MERKGSRGLPTGTITFLLADIEGSTRTWEAEDEEAVQKAVSRFYEILDHAISSRGGVRPVEQGEGDSVVGVFPRASDGISAALSAQKELGAEGWPTSSPLLVRMALHSGEAQLRDEGNYFGPVVNRCARLRELAHGAQVLVSRATHDLVADQLPEEVSLKDLGSHRLKDLGRPEETFQLCHPDLSDDFPALRSLDSRPHNLPAQLTRFIGREQEIRTVTELVERDRLVTLTGAGGCGKTRLALQVAAGLVADHPDGVWWVDLAAISDPDLVPNTVGAAMGIREVPGESFTATLERVCANRHTLVLLDNCEHLIEACAELCDVILRSCPRLVVLATSREPLGVDGETTSRVPSLSVAEGTEALEQSEAVRLFCDRAERARPTFALTEENAEAVAQICRRLDGIPLAIELASSRIRALTPEQIALGLDDRFRLLSGGTRTALPRQRTLEASVDWSHELLDDQQRTLFRRLSVFAGSFALDSAEEVCSGEGLEPHKVFELLVGLVDRSLVQVEQDPNRYRMLETIRQYGRHKLVDVGEADPVRLRHLDHYAELTERAVPFIARGVTTEWLDRLDRELDNMRAAMDWALASGHAATGLVLATPSLYWGTRGYANEGQSRIQTLLEAADPEPELRARALTSLAHMAVFRMDPVETMRVGEEAVATARSVGAKRSEALALTCMGAMMTFTDPEGASGPLAEGLGTAEETGDWFCENWAKFSLGATRLQLGDTPGAIRYLDEAVDAARGSYTMILCGSLLWRTSAHLFRGQLDAADRDLSDGLEVARVIGDQFFGRMLAEGQGLVAALRGDHGRGRELVQEALRGARETGNLFVYTVGKLFLSWVERLANEVDACASAAEEAEGVLRVLGEKNWLAWGLAALAWAEMRRGNLDRAAALLDDALPDGSSVVGMATLVHVTRTALARQRGNLAEAEENARRALVEPVEVNVFTPDALDALGGVLVALDDHQDATRLIAASDSLRSHTGVVRPLPERPIYEADLTTARSVLGNEAFDAAWAEGAAMSAEEAIAYATRGRGKRRRPSHGWESLTPTELDVVGLVAEGLTNPQIAEKLFISRGTVKTHLSHIFAKLGVSTRAELATQATRRGVDSNEEVGA
jgi:predicted ATPase/class 3 adenylate cyclase/DNA-binding CsgD family transcriptional regulator